MPQHGDVLTAAPALALFHAVFVPCEPSVHVVGEVSRHGLGALEAQLVVVLGRPSCIGVAYNQELRAWKPLVDSLNALQVLQTTGQDEVLVRVEVHAKEAKAHEFGSRTIRWRRPDCREMPFSNSFSVMRISVTAPAPRGRCRPLDTPPHTPEALASAQCGNSTQGGQKVQRLTRPTVALLA